jgi:hypothetical protein
MGDVHTTVLLGVVSGVARVISPETQRECGETCTRSHGMDGIRELLSAARDNGLAAGHFLGLLHIAIGRKITRPDSNVVSTGFTWRTLAQELKNLRFDQELVRELGTDPDELAARDRERFWYSAIASARVDSPEAVTAGDLLAPKLKNLGFIIGPAPATLLGATQQKARAQEVKTPPPKLKEKEKDARAVKKKKK